MSTVTDSAANMVKAFSLPGYKSYDNDSNEDEENEDIHDTEDLESVLVDEELGEVVDISMPAYHESFPSRISCFSHTLQLVVSDGLKEAGQLKTIINRVSKLVSHVRKSHHSSELLENCNKLQQLNATRWNSQFKMLRSLLQVPQVTRLILPGNQELMN